MKLADITEDYFSSEAMPKLKAAFPNIAYRLAAGLVGNGSECFGLDDEISRDHDWGVDFYIWVAEEDSQYIPLLAKWKEELLSSLPEDMKRKASPLGAKPDVSTAKDFYKRLVGCAERPESLLDWMRIPEENLAMAVNGRVFCDGTGEFTSIRKAFLEYYPEDVRKKFLAARCMALAQTGQYNLPRCLRRGDYVTSRICLEMFIRSAMSAVFLLNRRYSPYYKWQFAMLKTLPLLGGETAALLSEMREPGQCQEQIEEVCRLIADELRRQGLSAESDSFMASHGLAVQASIKDDILRSLPVQFG